MFEVEKGEIERLGPVSHVKVCMLRGKSRENCSAFMLRRLQAAPCLSFAGFYSAPRDDAAAEPLGSNASWNFNPKAPGVESLVFLAQGSSAGACESRARRERRRWSAHPFFSAHGLVSILLVVLSLMPCRGAPTPCTSDPWRQRRY